MSHLKQASTRKRNSKTMPLLGAAGLSLSLIGGISAASGAPAPAADIGTRNVAASHEVTLCEQEVTDVSLATFHAFDHENARTFRRGVKFAAGGCGCGNG
jgi:hypothetical protein